MHSHKKFKISISDKKEEVTDMDIMINKSIASYISQFFPNDIIIGEEYSINFNGNSNNDRIWLIDPIDGTRSYINKIKGYSIIIAFLHNFIPTIGFIWDARSSMTNIAIRGEGIYQYINNSFEKYTPHVTVLKKLLWNPYNPNMLKHIRLKKSLIDNLNLTGVIEIESCGLRAIDLASKKGSVFLSIPNSAKIWDTAAGHVFIKEAGGIYTDIHGSELIYSVNKMVHEKGAIASIDINHDDVLKYVNDCLTSKRCYK